MSEPINPSDSRDLRYSRTELNSMKVKELKELLSSLDIYDKGTKAELVNRASQANILKSGNEPVLDIERDVRYRIIEEISSNKPLYLQMQYAVANKDRVLIAKLKEKATDVSINVSSNKMNKSKIIKAEELEEFYRNFTEDASARPWNIFIENNWIKCYVQSSRIFIKFMGDSFRGWNIELRYVTNAKNTRKIAVDYIQFVYTKEIPIEDIQELLLGFWWVRSWIFTEIKFSNLLGPDSFKVLYLNNDTDSPEEKINNTSKANAHANAMFNIMKKIGKA